MMFTQFMYPHGRRVANHIDMPAEIEALAKELFEAGWSFEIECHPDTQMVHMDCCDDESPIAMRTVANGPEVPLAVERLVREAHERWVKLERPQAEGARGRRAAAEVAG